MEVFQGGASQTAGCAMALIGLAAAGVGLVVATGGIGLIATAVGWSVAPAALACLDY